ncbi:MAG: type II secretion system F family protein, partial [Candidatus Omnitrophica bacterium]|nr:type II secretion system F family protein [Candidatus Omnitrophota bacterium]
MPTFKYVAKEQSGRTVTGMMDSTDVPAVVESLRKRNLFVISVDAGQVKRGGVSRGRKKVKSDDMVIFSRQLATMVDAGI